MTTFATMKTRIVDETLRDDLTAAQLNNAINNAIRQWEGERFMFNEKRHRILTVQGQEYYPLIGPTLLTSAGGAVATGEMVLELDNITITINNQPYSLNPRTQQWMDEQQGSATFLGQPCDYAIFGNELRLFPVPDAVYPLNLSNLARLGPNPLSADIDTNAWMTEGEALIRHHSKMLIYRDVLRDNDGAALAAEGLKEAEHHLKRKMAAKAYTGRQKAWSL